MICNHDFDYFREVIDYDCDYIVFSMNVIDYDYEFAIVIVIVPTIANTDYDYPMPAVSCRPEPEHMQQGVNADGLPRTKSRRVFSGRCQHEYGRCYAARSGGK